jgi:hypothetical protein
MRDKYKVTIKIETVDGYSISVEMEDCPRDALMAQPNIAPALEMLEDSLPKERA